MNCPRNRVNSRLFLPAVVLLALLLPTVGVAQSSDAAANMKAHDFNQKTHEMPSPGQQAYTNAQGYLGRIKALEDEREAGEELSPRQNQKLEKYYRKAIENLDRAIEEMPEWKEPRLARAALYYNQGDYETALSGFQDVLVIDPEDSAAKAFVRQTEAHLDARDTTGDADGR